MFYWPEDCNTTPKYRSEGRDQRVFDVEKAYRELLCVISSLKRRINSAPIQEHSGISQQYQTIGIDNDEILQKTAGLALELMLGSRRPIPTRLTFDLLFSEQVWVE